MADISKRIDQILNDSRERPENAIKTAFNELEPVIMFEIECSYCKKTYALKVYRGSKVLYQGTDVPEINVDDIKTSHGACEICLDQVYAELGVSRPVNKDYNK